MKEKKIIIITSIIAFAIICCLVVCSFLVFKENEIIRNSDTLYIVVEQEYPDKSREIIYQEIFTEDLVYEQTIYSVKTKGGHNTIKIANGKCIVCDCNCPNRTCETYKVLLINDSFFSNNTNITCDPNGLYIYLSPDMK